MTDKEYNGWTNYETWLVKLWMDNDKGSYNYFRALAENYFQRDDEDGFAEAIQAHHQQIIDASIPASGWIADLIGAAMSEVNWGEIAHSLLSDVKEGVA